MCNCFWLKYMYNYIYLERIHIDDDDVSFLIELP